ncbi:ribosomal-protein-alanine N-acetyltransferase [Salirhabdus euzebyi]|uniref:Ribosomal-protein-alanine N-acetyltransferase n=1 Tax=Salirhabdus euzebyi TaxID=394506 RepID=A0A841Q3Z2_9BACI|nr:GNAT family protein [Salirhabdus euzebyi]MBB6453114.1 ribosomal-protein-alanine N-acetyltransferase [Salirhabdus euzebyi]
MGFPVLETERLRLMEIGENHIQAYFDIMSLDQVTQYYGMDSLENLEQAENIINSFLAGFETKRSMRWAIVLKENNTFIGTIGFNNLMIRNKRTEVGYEIHPNYWRNGYTSEALKEIINYGFEEFDLFRIAAVTYPENKPSWKMLEKIGFEKEGLLRGYLYQHNKSNDAFIFSLIRPDWKKQ